MVTTRRGYGKGLGCGYKNLMPKDPFIHGLSAKGVKYYQGTANVLFTVKAKNQEEVGTIIKHKLNKFNDVEVGNIEDVSSPFKRDKQLLSQLSINAKGSSISAEMSEKFTPQQLKVLRNLQYQYYPSQNLWSLKWSKKPSELFVLETQLGISHNEAKKLAIKYLDTLEKYPSEKGLSFMGYKLDAKKSCIDKFMRPVPKGRYNKTQVNKGIKVEMEHTKVKKVARRIAKQHLAESPKYYKALSKMEKRLGI